MPEPIVRAPGGNLVRVLATLGGFRAKHDVWPTELRIDADALATLRDHHLTAPGFRLLQARVRLVAAEGGLSSRGAGGRAFDYDSEGWSCAAPDQSAEEWLGFQPTAPRAS